MKPGKFTYHRPTSLESAFNLLDEHGDEAKIIAGGQSLVPVMNLRLAQPEHLIDINAINELQNFSEEAEHIIFGSLTRHGDIEKSTMLETRCPIMPAAARNIGHLAIRTRGTIGGSLVNADPAAEWSLIAILLGAEMTVRSANSVRNLSARDFIQSVYTSDVEDNEILTSIRFPVIENGEGWSIQQVCRRVGDFAIVAVAVTLRLNSSGDIENVRLCVGGMDVTPLRLSELENSSVGHPPDQAWISSVAEASALVGDPESDMHASATYRREICEELTGRALKEALQRTQKSEGKIDG